MTVAIEPVNPPTLAAPRGFSHGMKGSGELLFVAGQVGWDGEGRLVADDLVLQFGRALDNVLQVITAAGGAATSLARLTIYVMNRDEYRERFREIGEAYRARMGRHYPAIALVEVNRLLEDGAKVEIEAIALL